MSGIRSTCSDLLWQPFIIAEVLYGGTTAKKNTSFYHLHSKDATFPTAMGSTLLFFPFINHVVWELIDKVHLRPYEIRKVIPSVQEPCSKASTTNARQKELLPKPGKSMQAIYISLPEH